MTIRVVHFVRRPSKGVFSMERLFEDVRAHLPSDMQVQVHANRFPSHGVWPRLRDAWRARRHQGEINHVTGDVHYLTYFLHRKRTILTIHDCVALQRSDGLRHWLLWLFWYWLPEKRCANISVISESTRRQVLEYLRCAPGKVRVIHDNVSEEFQAASKPFNGACPRVLHVGTPANKNLERHAAALQGLDCELIIIGPLTDAQCKVLVDHGIRYENHFDLSREALVEQYERCDLLLFASTYEGFGLPIVEAQAIGRPVVTSNLWSMPEVAGDAACLVDPFDVASIRAGVEKVINDAGYRESLVRRGFENVERFRVEAIAAQYAALYREVHAMAQRGARQQRNLGTLI